MYSNFEATGEKLCIAYGDEVTYDNRAHYEEVIERVGYQVNQWLYDDRALMGLPLTHRPALRDAVALAYASTLPLWMPDWSEERGLDELVMVVLTCRRRNVQLLLGEDPLVSDEGGHDFVNAMLLPLVWRYLNFGQAVDQRVVELLKEHLDGLPAVRSVEDGPVSDSGCMSEVLSIDAVSSSSRFAWWQVRRSSDPRIPDLPDLTAPWPIRRREIGRFAHTMRWDAGWRDESTAELLNELGSRSIHGCHWYGALVSYYRNRYGWSTASAA